ncbi:hypothetical protein ACSV9I_14310 [Rhizobium sp. G187]|uniref:hypothetical protein n=1 Tax=Rhizobium sp. G187 TaxID=3451352 RepID=UPI003EE49F89
MKAASHSQALAGTLNVSMANAGIGLGALIGGATIKHWDLADVGYVAASIAVSAAALAMIIRRLWPSGDR